MWGKKMGLIGLTGLMICGCSTVSSRHSETGFASGEKIRFEPDDSFPQEYRHRITESLTRHGFVIVEDKTTPLSCTAEFSGGVTRCTAWVVLRRDGRPIIKVREVNAWFPTARSAQEARVKVAIEKFDRELGKNMEAKN